jgi:hypothetical protein
MTDFVMCNNLANVVSGLKAEEEKEGEANLERIMEKLRGGCDYVTGDMKPEHEKVVIDMISREDDKFGLRFL